MRDVRFDKRNIQSDLQCANLPHETLPMVHLVSLEDQVKEAEQGLCMDLCLGSCGLTSSCSVLPIAQGRNPGSWRLSQMSSHYTCALQALKCFSQ